MLEVIDPYIGGAFGFSLWLCLHRRDVPGDYFLLGTIACTAAVATILASQNKPHAIMVALSHTAICLSSLALSTVAYRLSPFHPLAAYPGPLLWRVSSLGFAFASWDGHRHLLLEKLHQRHGKFVRVGPNALSISDATDLLTIYGAKYHMAKPDSYKIPGRNPAHALFFQQTKEVHAARKQIWQQAFTPAALDGYVDPLTHHVRRLIRCIEERSTSEGLVNISDCLGYWAYDVMGDITFGGSNGLSMLTDGDPDQLIEGGKVATALLDSFGHTPWVMDILWHVVGLGPIKRLKALAASMVHARMKATDVKVVDIMHYLLKGDPRTGEEVSVPDLEIDAVVAMQGGSDNTSTTLILALYFLSCNPVLYRRLQKELDAKLLESGGNMGHKMLTSVPLLDAVILEALRFGSPYYLPRVVPPGGAVIGGRSIPAGTIVAGASHAEQMSERNFYPHPRSYMPERWLPGGLGRDTIVNRHAISSFSFGPHVCIGRMLAMQEMRICLAHLITTFEIQLPSGKDDGGEFYRGLRNMRTTFFDQPLVVRALRRELAESS